MVVVVVCVCVCVCMCVCVLCVGCGWGGGQGFKEVGCRVLLYVRPSRRVCLKDEHGRPDQTLGAHCVCVCYMTRNPESERGS